MNKDRWTWIDRDGKRVRVKITKEYSCSTGTPYTRTEFEDGSAESDFGGPCGPIYTDCNGEM